MKSRNIQGAGEQNLMLVQRQPEGWVEHCTVTEPEHSSRGRERRQSSKTGLIYCQYSKLHLPELIFCFGQALTNHSGQDSPPEPFGERKMLAVVRRGVCTAANSGGLVRGSGPAKCTSLDLH